MMIVDYAHILYINEEKKCSQKDCEIQSSSPLMLGSLLLLQPRATIVANSILLGDPEIPSCMENIIDDVLQIQEITFF